MENLIIKNRIIAEDLKSAGFRVDWRPGMVVVGLAHRSLGAYEVERALDMLGYEDCQYESHTEDGLVIVEAV